ncbi:TetR/AcrR family transcriptional regulator [Mycobacterium talmoniae]|nr:MULTISPECIES: TetR/AcrR family transcriptional regulator [Mycobacterium]OHV05994.1 TetR family transcriptional regulator [Mycobacterium talmoniae]TDH56784.1 TetR/AcrR family transcriptional regulator [Mycobacterium eburneum]
MSTERSRPYHHGDLVRAAIEGAVEEVNTVGVGAVSMRRIARRAGVSHAALAYQFGDKTGIFTAVAAEGFRLQAKTIGGVATGPDGFLSGGQAYVQFAVTHPGYFEVMFRPYLYRADDPALVAAREAAFDLLYGSARASLQAQRKAAVSDDDVLGVAMAGWSIAHGFATLLLTANLPERLQNDPAASVGLLMQGVVTLGDLVRGRA